MYLRNIFYSMLRKYQSLNKSNFHLPSSVVSATILSDIFFSTLEFIRCKVQTIKKLLTEDSSLKNKKYLWIVNYLPLLHGSRKPFEKMMLLPKYFSSILQSCCHMYPHTNYNKFSCHQYKNYTNQEPATCTQGS